MSYKKYTATEGKVLLNLNTFNTCIEVACKISTNLNVIEVSEEDAVYYNQKYKEELEKKEYEEHFGVQEEPVIEEDVHLLRGTKSAPKDSLTIARESFLEELQVKGYDLTNKVIGVIHGLNK